MPVLPGVDLNAYSPLTLSVIESITNPINPERSLCRMGQWEAMASLPLWAEANGAEITVR